MNGYALKDGVVFLKLESLGGVLAVFGGDITRSTGHTAGLMFGAFEDDLHAITFSFLCHSLESYNFNVFLSEEAFLGSLIHGSVEAEFVDSAQTCG